MTKQEIMVEIETLRMAIGCNTAFLKGMVKGSDPKTEASIASDRARLAELRKLEVEL